LSRYFGTSERFWLNLQSRYDLEGERERLASSWTPSRRSPAEQRLPPNQWAVLLIRGGVAMSELLSMGRTPLTDVADRGHRLRVP
jgi:hypothetical protein